MDHVRIGERDYYWDGRYYARHTGIRVPRRAHIDVWEDANGPVPEGFHVHHIDGDTRNNALCNLELLDGREHVRQHGNTDKARENMRKAQVLGVEAAKEWHKSADGKAWHKEHFVEVMQKIGTLVCKECKKEFTPTNFRQKFCCNRCNNRSKMRAWRERKRQTAVNRYDN